MTPLVVGHRGCGRNAPGNPFRENTLASALAAHAAGADWVEIDVVVSADGDLFLNHDHFLAGDQRPVWQVSSADLLARGLETLDEFEAHLPAGLGLYVEAKVVPGDVHPSLGPGSLIALQEWMRPRVGSRPMVFASFDAYAVAAARGAGLPVALITERSRPFLTAVTTAALGQIPVVVVHGGTLDEPPAVLAAAFETARTAGVAVWTWDTPLAEVGLQSAAGVCAFCVDDVAGALSALGC